MTKSDNLKQQFLIFDLTEKLQCMISTEFLIEVTTFDTQHIVPIVNLPHAIMGVSTYRSDILGLIDLAALLGLPALYTKPNRQSFETMVVRYDDKLAGLAVLHVGQLFHAKRADIHRISSQQLPAFLRKCITNLYHPANGEDMLVMNMIKLFDILNTSKAITEL